MQREPAMMPARALRVEASLWDRSAAERERPIERRACNDASGHQPVVIVF